MKNLTNTSHISIILLFVFFLLLNMVFPLSADTSKDWQAIKEDTKGCQLIHFEQHPFYKYTDSYPWARDIINKFRLLSCLSVENKTATLEDKNRKINNMVVFYAICRGSTINPSYKLFIKGSPRAVYNVYNEFCRCTYDPTNSLKMVHTKVLEEKIIWLSKELFCQEIRQVAYSDSWMEVLRPEDSPTLKRLEVSADNICNDLRNGKISLNEAQYRFNQEIAWFMDHFPKESVRRIIEPFKSLLDALTD